MNSNRNRPLTANLKFMDMSSLLANYSKTFLHSEIEIDIDPTVSHLWLPVTVCNQIQEVFGLRYEEQANIYTINDTAREFFLKSPTLLKFQLGSKNGTVNITLPYTAFDLEATYPLFANKTRYFPLRRSQSTFTLGRVFLQEAYIIVDHERGNFSVHHASGTNDHKAISAILPVDLTPKGPDDVPPTSHRKMRNVKIAGIATGSALFIGLLAVFWIFWRQRKMRKARIEKHTKLPNESWEKPMLHSKELHELFAPNGKELEGTPQVEIEGVPHTEIDGTPRAELDGTSSAESSRESSEVEEGERRSQATRSQDVTLR